MSKPNKDNTKERLKQFIKTEGNINYLQQMETVAKVAASRFPESREDFEEIMKTAQEAADESFFEHDPKNATLTSTKYPFISLSYRKGCGPHHLAEILRQAADFMDDIADAITTISDYNI